MNRKNIDIQDEKIKALLSETKITASKNLKFRIMHQIETEKALSRKKAPRPFILDSMLSIYGLMYTIIIALGVLIYFTLGKNILLSTKFYVPVILVSIISGMYWLIICFDERRRSKKQQ